MAQLDEWLGYLTAEAGATKAVEVNADVLARAALLDTFPERFRASPLWDDLRELPLEHWNKLVIYRVFATEVVIVALYDMRQDLSAVHPLSE